MREMGTPSLDRLLVAPEGQRQNLTLDRQAGEPLDRDEAVDLLELRPERGGDVEVILVMVGLGLNLENYSVHGIFSGGNRSHSLPRSASLAKPSKAAAYRQGSRKSPTALTVATAETNPRARRTPAPAPTASAMAFSQCSCCPRSEAHTSDLQSLLRYSAAASC